MKVTIAKVIAADGYTWYQFKGPAKSLVSGKGAALRLVKGAVFGVRPSTDGKKQRLVEQGKLTKVFTISQELLDKLTKNSTKKRAVAPVVEEEEEIQDIQYYDDFNKAARAFVKRVGSGKYGFDLGLWNTWGAQIKILKKYQNTKKEQAAVEKVIAWFNKPVWTKQLAKACKDKKAIAVARQILANIAKNQYFFSDVDDPLMFDFSTGDARDHFYAACLIYSGASAAKVEKATRLDTASRELFPDRAWDWIQENAR